MCFRSFLVSFVVDARGGAMCGCRHSGVRFLIPPDRACMPTRVTCKLIKKDRLVNPPPLMENEALACRIVQTGPVGTQFLGYDLPSPVASLGLVSPVAATDGVTPIFSWKKLTTFLLITVTLLDFTRVSPQTSFYLSDLVCPLFFLNSATKLFYFLRVSSPWRVSPGSRRPRRPPTSDATTVDISWCSVMLSYRDDGERRWRWCAPVNHWSQGQGRSSSSAVVSGRPRSHRVLDATPTLDSLLRQQLAAALVCNWRRHSCVEQSDRTITRATRGRRPPPRRTRSAARVHIGIRVMSEL